MSKRPALTKQEESLIQRREKPYLLGVRGFYKDMGNPSENDRAIYDDAIFLVTPSEIFSWNANTDPSAYRDGIATLQPGEWLYQIGIHGISKPKDKQYKAFIQFDKVTVFRDNQKSETGFFGINIHRGGVTKTSSLGCQTIPPDQWDEFFDVVCRAMASNNQKVITYKLAERDDTIIEPKTMPGDTGKEETMEKEELIEKIKLAVDEAIKTSQDEKIQEAVKKVKPGVKTSEFWMVNVIVCALFGFAGAMGYDLPAESRVHLIEVVGSLASAAGIAYTAFRSHTKKRA